MTLTPPDLTELGGTPTERVMAERDSKNPIEDSMDMLRLLEYPQLMGKTYLDHAGATVSNMMTNPPLPPPIHMEVSGLIVFTSSQNNKTATRQITQHRHLRRRFPKPLRQPPL